jgi:hypothetical protein
MPATSCTAKPGSQAWSAMSRVATTKAFFS